MDRKTHRPDSLQTGGGAVEPLRLIDIDTELVLAATGRDLFVGLGVDIGIDAQRDRRLPPHRPRDVAQYLQLDLGFDVELPNPGLQRERHFGAGLADPGEYGPSGRDTGRQRPAQLSLRHHIGAGAAGREGGDHGDVRVGLDGIADLGAEPRQRIGIGVVVVGQRLGRIAVKRRADRRRDVGEIDLLRVEPSVSVGECRHRGYCLG